MEIKLKDLLEAGCHFGHQVTRWNPKMKPYIFTTRDKVHIFDLAKTKECLETASAFIKETVGQGNKIVFVGTKRQAKDIIKEAAIKLGMPYVSERWIGGTLTNWDRIKRNIDKLAELKTGKETGEFKDYTKKENLLIDRKIIRLEHFFGGLADLEKMPGALFIVDIKKEAGAAKEARARGIKVVALVDTNSDPNLADFVIPANDDAVKSIQFVVDFITEAVEAGLKQGKNPASAEASAGRQKSKIKKEKEEETKETKETEETKVTKGETKTEKEKKPKKKSIKKQKI